MKINLILALTEKQSEILRAVLLILLILVIALVILGLIGNLIEKIISLQADQVNSYMTNVVAAKLIHRPQDFKRIAKLKNKILFFKQSIPPVLIAIAGLIVYLIYHSFISTGNWSESIFDTKTGIMSLFYTYDFSNLQIEYVFPFGFKFNNILVTHEPLFNINHLCNYITFTLYLIAFVYYLIVVQGYIARYIRIYQLSKKLYSLDMSKLDVTYFYNLNKINPNLNSKDEANKNTENQPK